MDYDVAPRRPLSPTWSLEGQLGVSDMIFDISNSNSRFSEQYHFKLTRHTTSTCTSMNIMPMKVKLYYT